MTGKPNHYFFDTKHVRYQLYQTNGGYPYNWLFFPGGPGADSAYLGSLVATLDLPGNVWLIDLPGNGSNTAATPPDYAYDQWLQLFPETIQAFTNPVLVGHSFGGMIPLLYPELEGVLAGLVILNSAPTLWLEEAVRYAKQFELPDLTQEMTTFTQNPNPQTFKVALEACMPYYFPKQTLAQGKKLLVDLPFQFQAAGWWQNHVLEHGFAAKWIPQQMPTMIVGGKYDCIAPFTLFQNYKPCHRDNIKMIYLDNGGHCGWVEDPKAIKQGFDQFIADLPR